VSYHRYITHQRNCSHLSHVCQNLSKWSEVCQSYQKNNLVQFFCPTWYILYWRQIATLTNAKWLSSLTSLCVLSKIISLFSISTWPYAVSWWLQTALGAPNGSGHQQEACRHLQTVLGGSGRLASRHLREVLGGAGWGKTTQSAHCTITE